MSSEYDGWISTFQPSCDSCLIFKETYSLAFSKQYLLELAVWFSGRSS